MRIGLVAMSGLRVQNTALKELGLTMPGVLERGQIVASLPSLGLLTLAGMTPPEFDVSYEEVDGPVNDSLVHQDIDLVAISSFTARIRDAYALADAYRTQGSKVVLGGLHVSAVPDEAMKHADSVVIGEGELSWPSLLEDFKKGNLKPVYDGRGMSFDLAHAPIPRFDLLDTDRYNRLTVQTQRGCPFSCEFCAASIRISPAFKLKPVDRVIAEIRRIREIWPSPFIEFADDNTFANKRHGKRLLQALQHEHIRWFTETDISVAEDDELLGLMRDSGCKQVLIGLESPTHSGLTGVELKADWKAKQLDRYMDGIARIQQRGITVNGCFVLGLDGTGHEEFEAVEQFVRDSGLYDVQITVLTPFPGTPLYERLRQEGRLLKEEAWEHCTLFDVNFRPQQMSAEELESAFLELARKLYDRGSWTERLAVMANRFGIGLQR